MVFPPLQAPASYNLNQVMDQIKSEAGHPSDKPKIDDTARECPGDGRLDPTQTISAVGHWLDKV